MRERSAASKKSCRKPKETPTLARSKQLTQVKRVAAAAGKPRLFSTAMTFLEEQVHRRVVSAERYLIALSSFATFCLGEGLNWSTDTELDALAAVYLNCLFFGVEGMAAGNYFVAALKHVLPQFSRFGASRLSHCTKALKGWAVVSPPMQRLPCPLVVAMAVMALFLGAGKVRLALAV